MTALNSNAANRRLQIGDNPVTAAWRRNAALKPRLQLYRSGQGKIFWTSKVQRQIEIQAVITGVKWAAEYIVRNQKRMELDTTKIIRDFVDYLMPELKPHETSVYLYLLTKSYLCTGSAEVREGQRTLAPQYGRGKKNQAPARQQLIRQLKALEAKGCIRIGDTNRDGTLYTVLLPMEIPLVRKKLSSQEPPVHDDFYTVPEKRNEIYERDNWICGYCGDSVTSENATLDHIIPQSKRGTHAKGNLRTACLICNSIKSGKTEEEAAMPLLKSIRERHARKAKP